jgi:uncharacterized protein involved in response to NO
MKELLARRPEPAPAGLASVLAHPFLALGFRPFFLLAGILATLWIPLWLLMLWGLIPAPEPLGGLGWHRHEMVFGYTLGVVAGFLLTAAGNWTGQPMPRGGHLLALVLLWLLARVGLLIAHGPWAVGFAFLDVLFPLAVAAALFPRLWRTANYRNLGFVPLLALVALANALVHLYAFGVTAWDEAAITRFALNLIVLVMVVMGGRVIPFFTANALGDSRVRRIAMADRASVALVAAMAVADLLPLQGEAQGLLAMAAAGANAWRMTGWRSWDTRRQPILWVLHLAYLWIVAGLALKGLSGWTVAVPATLAIHSLTVGGIGGLTLGMMSRVSLGHTGRPIVAPGPIVLAYVLVNLAAFVRVLLPLFAPGITLTALWLAGLCWTAAFALFVWVYAPILARPRADRRTV